MNKRNLTFINVIVAVAATIMSMFLFIYTQKKFNSYVLSLTPIATVSPTSIVTPTPTNTPKPIPNLNVTATVGAALTQAAVAQLTIVPTTTFLPQSQPANENLALRQEIVMLRLEVVILQTKVASLPANNPQNANMSNLQESVNSLDQRLENIETVILDSPEKALEVTLLRQEIENAKNISQQDTASTKEEIARMYDLNKWFLGLMFTMAVSLVSLAVNNYLKVTKQSENIEPAINKPKSRQSKK